MSSFSKRHHVIIGDGLTAAEFAKCAPLSSGDRLTIVGPNSKELGRGLAYRKVSTDSPWHMTYLLNSPSESVDPDFGKWVCENWSSIARRMQGKHPNWLAAGEEYISQDDYSALNAPREVYGDYLSSLVNKSLYAAAERGVIVERVHACATNIEYHSDKQLFSVALDTGKELIASRVDIATGGAQTQSLFEADNQYSFARLYGHEEAIAKRLKQGGRVVCLGTNAAMLDTLRLAQAVRPSTPINFIAISTSARLPEALIPSQPRKLAKVTLKPHYASAQDLYLSLLSQMDDLRGQGYRMAEMRSPFKAAILEAGLESLLSDSNETRKVLGLMERLFMRGTRDSLADFQTWRDNGQARLVAAKLVDIKAESDVLSLTISHRDGTKEVVSASVLVNCSGAGSKPYFDAMTELLLKKGWLARCSVSGGIEVGEGLQAGPKGLRYLSPTVTVMGEKVLALSLYDASTLMAVVRAASI